MGTLENIQLQKIEKTSNTDKRVAMSESKYKTWHTDQLIEESININAELQARMKGVMFGLSCAEDFKSEDDRKKMITLLMQQLRGQ